MSSIDNPENGTARDKSSEETFKVGDAIRVAKEWLIRELADERPSNIGVEEVEHERGRGIWNITLGFSRPWNTTRNALTVISGETAVKRVQKILVVDENSREVVSMRNRDKE